MAHDVDIARLDPAARGRDETGIALRLGTLLDGRALPYREPATDRALLRAGKPASPQVPLFGDPGHRLAIGRVDKAMPEPQPVIERDRRAFDLKAAAGAQ